MKHHSNENWYDYAEWYDIAFDWDTDVEMEFFEKVFQEHVVGGGVRRVFEPFCGTGRLIRPLAKAGYEVSGVDINVNAVEYAQNRLQTLGLNADLKVGDVCDWKTDTPVDVVLTVIDSFRHLADEDSAERATRAFSNGLRTGGLFIVGIELGEPGIEITEHNHWDMQRDGLVVETTVFGLRQDAPTPGATMVRSIMHVTDEDGVAREVLTDQEMRVYTMASLKEMVTTAGDFECVAAYDYYELGTPISLDSSPDDNTVVVFQKR